MIYDIIIIGGGCSGLACAYKLNNSNKNVLVLESQNQLGGRVRDHQFNKQQIQIGGEELHGIQSQYAKIIINNGGKMTNVLDEKESLFQIGDELIQSDEFEQKYEKADDLFEQLKIDYENTKEEENNISMKQYLNDFDDKLMDYFQSEYGSEWGTTIENISWRGIGQCLKEWQFGEVNECITNQTQLQTIIKAFCNNLKYNLNVRVKQIDYNNEIIEIKDQNNQIYQCKKAVVAVPITILQKQIIEFLPKLENKKIEAINQLGMDKGGKIFIHFKQKFYGDFQEIRMKSQISHFYWDHTGHLEDKQDGLILAGLVNHLQDQLINNSNRQQIIEIIIDEFSSLFKIDKQEMQDLFIDYFYYSWSQNEDIQGLYSYPKVGYKDNTRQIIMENINKQIYFCGEHCHNTDYATIHGAIENGLEIGQLIIDS